MKSRVCFKDHYPCRAETCGEYDVCKIRLTKEKQTNEKWFCRLSTREKAKEICRIEKDARTFTDGRSFYSTVEDDIKYWESWLKQQHNSEEK